MAPSRLLKARLDRIEAAIGAAPREPDLSYLEGWEIDRLLELRELLEKGPTPQLLEEFEEIVARCPILPPGIETRLRPSFPQSLIRYWRWQGSVDPRLPRGYFSARKLCYASRDRLIELCLEYGWDDETGETDAILPIDQWQSADLAELTGILREALGYPSLDRRHAPRGAS
jgi:hypothetical protein